MTRFILGRAALLVGGWTLASVIIFVTLRLLPGDVAQIVGGTQASPARVAQLREQLGLNLPIHEQYWAWITGIFSGNLGTSIVSNTPIAAEIWEKSAVTIPLALLSLVIALVIALPLGFYAAYRKQNLVAETIASLSIVAAAVPVVWAGLLLILVFSTWLGWFPSQGFPQAGWSDPVRALGALLLPALTVGLVEAAVLFRFVRSATYAALNAEHVRTAMSFGYSHLHALIRSGLPGVGLSIVSVLGLQFAGLLTGAVVVEQLFRLPGLGRMLLIDIGNRDLVKVQSTLLVLTGLVLIVGVLIDVIHRLIDPRLRVRQQ